MEAIRLIRIVADHIGKNQDAFETLGGDDIALIPLADRVWLRGWFPLMFELSAVIRLKKISDFIKIKIVLIFICPALGLKFFSV